MVLKNGDQESIERAIVVISLQSLAWNHFAISSDLSIADSANK
jgi:hypothetical protein